MGSGGWSRGGGEPPGGITGPEQSPRRPVGVDLGPAPGALCTGRCGRSRAGRLQTLPGAASTGAGSSRDPEPGRRSPAGTYLLQPTSLPYCTAAASPWRKASCRPGTAPSPSSPRSRSPSRETGGGGGSPPAPGAPPGAPRARPRGGTGGGVEQHEAQPRPLSGAAQGGGRAPLGPAQLRRREAAAGRGLQAGREPRQLREQPRDVGREAQRHGGGAGMQMRGGAMQSRGGVMQSRGQRRRHLVAPEAARGWG